jgi:hypothetical protein
VVPCSKQWFLVVSGFSVPLGSIGPGRAFSASTPRKGVKKGQKCRFWWFSMWFHAQNSGFWWFRGFSVPLGSIGPGRAFSASTPRKGVKKGSKSVVFGVSCHVVMWSCHVVPCGQGSKTVVSGFSVPLGSIGPGRAFSASTPRKGVQKVCFDPPEVVPCGFMWFHVVMPCSSMWSGGPKQWFRGFRGFSGFNGGKRVFWPVFAQNGSKRGLF